MSETADIGKQQIAMVYARALIGAAENANATASVVEELDSLVDDVLDKFPEFEVTLGSLRVTADEKMGVIDRVFGDASDLLRTFLKVLATHARLDCIRQVRQQARRVYSELRNRVTVEVTTAEALSDQQCKEIVDSLQAKMNCEVDLSPKIDENIIGGILVRVGDTIIDGSVRNKLNRLKSQVVQKMAEQIHSAGERFVSEGNA